MARRTSIPRTGIYKTVDFVVIGVLWLVDIFEPWISGWLDFTFEILYGDDYLKKGIVGTYGYPLLFFKCATCLVLSVNVDLKNHKAMANFIGTLLASMTPAFAILTIITESQVHALLTLTVKSVFSVVTPLRYVLIFNQRLNPSSTQVRKVVAALVVTKSLSTFCFYLSKPDPKTYRPHVLIVRWVLLIPMLVFLVTLMDVIRQGIAKDEPRERTFKVAMEGIQHDIKEFLITDDPESKRKKAKTIYQFSLFVVLILPFATVIVVNVILDKMEDQLKDEIISEPDVHSVQVVDYKFHAYVADIIAIPLIAVIITHFKQSLQTFGDYLLLTFAHLFNSALLVYLSISLMQNQLDPNQNATSIQNVTRNVIQPGASIVNIITYNDEEAPFEEITIIFETPESNYTLNETNEFVLQFPINLTVFEKIYPWRAFVVQTNSSWKGSTKITPNKRFVFFIMESHGVIKNIVEFKAEAVHFHPNSPAVPEKSMLLVGNGLTHEPEDDPYSPTFLLNPKDEPDDEITLNMPPPLTFLPVPIPGSGEWVFGYPARVGTIPVELEMKPNTETMVLVGDYLVDTRGSKTRGIIVSKELEQYSVSELIINETIIEHKVLNAPVSALKGISGAAISISYLQFLWLESPFRFRTTILSIVLMGLEIIQHVLDSVITDFTFTAVVILTSVVCILGVVHIVVGAIYEKTMRRELWYVTPASHSA